MKLSAKSAITIGAVALVALAVAFRVPQIKKIVVGDSATPAA